MLSYIPGIKIFVKPVGVFEFQRYIIVGFTSLEKILEQF